MTIFIRLLTEPDKANALLDSVRHSGPRVFEADPKSFARIPGSPFAYWASEAVLKIFDSKPKLEERVLAASGTGTLNDFRFLRAWWEICQSVGYFPYAKGGAYSPVYFDNYLVVQWRHDGKEMKSWIIHKYGGGSWSRNIRSSEHYFRPGLSWPRRTQIGLGMRVMPEGCIFADKGPGAFLSNDSHQDLLSLVSLTTSRPFCYLVELQMCFGSYEVGVIQRTPIPKMDQEESHAMAELAHRLWSLKRQLDTTNETSHAFVLPFDLLKRVLDGEFEPYKIQEEIKLIQHKIDDIAFDLYGLTGAERAEIEAWNHDAVISELLSEGDGDDLDEIDNEEAENEVSLSNSEALASWAIGVAFGRFDIKLATGKRPIPPEPAPFDPLPAKSAGMVHEDGSALHATQRILVDDSNSKHDLPRLIESTCERVNAHVPGDIRSWLGREFFPLHMKQYSKGKRKAPIYWPLATSSGSFTLWLYYPNLTSQTLYTAVNDFIEPKLKQVSQDVSGLRDKSNNRSRDDDRRLDMLQVLELELAEMRDILLQTAPTYHPNHDDGVQITAAPLWPLFRHKPWQKLLKDTWAKLEKGDYDWAHLAMVYWPARVRLKCKTDKSLAIAHGLEDLYEPPDETGGTPSGRGRKRRGDAS